jgi:hypothetical protein
MRSQRTPRQHPTIWELLCVAFNAVTALPMLFAVIVWTLIVAGWIMVPLITYHTVRTSRSKVYIWRIKPRCTCLVFPFMWPSEVDAYVNRLEEWSTSCGITLVNLNGPIFRKLPRSGRVLVADFGSSVSLYFLSKSDATLYKLAF